MTNLLLAVTERSEGPMNLISSRYTGWFPIRRR